MRPFHTGHGRTDMFLRIIIQLAAVVVALGSVFTALAEKA